MDIDEIYFNYAPGSYSYDALTLKKDNSTYVPVPEWDTGERNENFAYIKSQYNRMIAATFWTEEPRNYEMGVYNIKIGFGVGFGNVSETAVVFSETSYYSDPTIMTCNGSVYSKVSTQSFRWRWYATYIGDYEFEEPLLIGDSGPHNYYVVLAAPQSPMTEPWTSVLDYACVWAAWQTSSSGATEQVVQHIYNDLGLTYDTYEGAPRYTSNGKSGSFNLTDFLSDIPGSNLTQIMQ